MMVEHATKRKIKDMEYNAILHGADPKEFHKEEDVKENLLFGDPQEYSNLSEAEKEELTRKMENKFKKWASKSSLVSDKR